jgi:hypothetical protein
MSQMSAVGYFFSGGPAPGTHTLDVDGRENDGHLICEPLTVATQHWYEHDAESAVKLPTP